MTTVTTKPGENRVVLDNVRWQTFEALLADTDRAGSRFTYDEGALEIMSPSPEHELIKKLLARMIEIMTLELEIPIASRGNTTFKAEMKRKGIEPDECYYLANEPRVRGRMEIDLADDPPPDLAIEVDISSSSLDQLGIYAALGVPEIWICDGDTLEVYQLGDDRNYVRQDHSLAFPFLPIDQVQRFLDQGKTADETTWIRSFRSWVVDMLKR